MSGGGRRGEVRKRDVVSCGTKVYGSKAAADVDHRRPKQTVNVAEFAGPISDAARIVHARIPRHSLGLDDLVQIGWEAVQRYLSGQESASRVLVFVAAKTAMFNAHDRWIGREYAPNASGNRTRSGDVPQLTGFHEWTHCEPTPPIEMMIDVRRQLALMDDGERAAWIATRLEERTVREAADAIGCAPYTVIARARRADERLTGAVGEGPVERSGRTPKRTAKRDQWRSRYRELRALGVPVSKAVTTAHGSQHAYATLLRQVSPC